jgi:predicted Zn-dependent protease with MMP-like domain
MADGSGMIDWEGLAQEHLSEIQSTLPEPIRDRAMEVPVFFSDATDPESRSCLGIFEGFSLMEGSPAQPDQMPRITLFINTLTEAADHRRKAFLCEVRVTYLHELGHYFGWDEGQLANVGLE